MPLPHPHERQLQALVQMRVGDVERMLSPRTLRTYAIRTALCCVARSVSQIP